jgi:hypothetical protein
MIIHKIISTKKMQPFQTTFKFYLFPLHFNFFSLFQILFIFIPKFAQSCLIYEFYTNSPVSVLQFQAESFHLFPVVNLNVENDRNLSFFFDLKYSKVASIACPILIFHVDLGNIGHFQKLFSPNSELLGLMHILKMLCY